MDYSEQSLGTAVIFLLPSLKLKEPSPEGGTVELRLHTFLMEHFGGYTAQAGNIFGYWRDGSGRDSYGEHREFSVASVEDAKLPLLKSFVAQMAKELGEECIYLRAGRQASLIFPVADASSEA